MVTMHHPRDLAEALAIRKETGAIPYAGGTDLMVRHRRWPGLPMDLSGDVLCVARLPEIIGIRATDGTVWIGAATPYAAVIRDDRVPGVLRAACRLIGAPAIQNAGTIGGNLCNASPAADTVPPLSVLHATVQLASAHGERSVPVGEFISGPGETVLRPDELVTGVTFRRPEPEVKWRYRKVGTRRANALSKLSFAGMLSVSAGHVRDIRMALGAVAPTVVRRTDLEQELIDLPVAAALERLHDLLPRYRHALNPITDQRSDRSYRTEVSLRLIQQFIQQEAI